MPPSASSASTTSLRQRQILYLFERVKEPIFIPKANGNVIYKLPQEYYPDEYKELARSIAIAAGSAGPSSRAGSASSGTGTPRKNEPLYIDIKRIELPDLSVVKSIPRGTIFSYFLPSHREAALALTKIYLGAKSVDEMISLAALTRDQVNEYIFVYALSAAVARRPDLRKIRAPPIWEVLPEKFFDGLHSLEMSSSQVLEKRDPSAPVLVINRMFSATDRYVENRVSYFREDIGINSHHWHWHLIYPINDTMRRDRRGELFFYMHQQVLARYDAERFANHLARVKPYQNWREPIPEAYFPKLTLSNAALVWGSRPSNLILQDISIPDPGYDLHIRINDLENWRSRILHAIHLGFVENSRGEKVRLDGDKGIDMLGDMVEASEWSINLLLYGDLHNIGHVAMSFVHDPERSHRENGGVMFDTTVAMRDPIFYRWHKFIDDLFQEYKSTLNPYTRQQLGFPGIILKSIDVYSQRDGAQKNTFYTGWQRTEVELTRGLDFSSRHPVRARITHLQHEDFKYRIALDNTLGSAQEVVVRIFMAPIRDQAGRLLPFREQRTLMIELDKFVAKIPAGGTVVERLSSQSSVTIPFEQTFRELERPTSVTDIGLGTAPDDPRENYCGCGWPQHMLIPRGTPDPGMPFDLFAMVTSWKEDRVDASLTGKAACRNAASYCGVLDEKYPDKKPMGFPFDRPAATSTRTLTEFLTPNMKANQVRVIFEDRIIGRFP